MKHKKNKKRSNFLENLMKYGDRILQDWFQNGLLISERMIYLEGEKEDIVQDASDVSSNMASKFIKSITLLELLDQKKPIILVINTLGGSVYDGLAIYDRMRESPCPIIAFGYGSIMSMGAHIMQAADKRFISPSSTIMIHDGSTSSGDVHPKVMKVWADYDCKMNDRLHNILFGRMREKNNKLTINKVKKMCLLDTVFTAEEAVNVGLADEIIAQRRRSYDKLKK